MRYCIRGEAESGRELVRDDTRLLVPFLDRNAMAEGYGGKMHIDVRVLWVTKVSETLWRSVCIIQMGWGLKQS